MSKDMFNVTESIINRGEHKNCFRCPVAIALTRTGNWIGYWSVYSNSFMLLSEGRHTQYIPSHRLSDIIRRYDEGYEMPPFSIVVDSDDFSVYLEGENDE